MKTNYRHQKKLKEQARLTRQAEKLQRRAARPEQADAPDAVVDVAANVEAVTPAKPGP